MKRIREKLDMERPVWNGRKWRGYLDSMHMPLKGRKELYLLGRLLWPYWKNGHA
jgi:hypothetical protein